MGSVTQRTFWNLERCDTGWSCPKVIHSIHLQWKILNQLNSYVYSHVNKVVTA